MGLNKLTATLLALDALSIYRGLLEDKVYSAKQFIEGLPD